MEQTFVMVKPDHVEIADKVLEELDSCGRRVVTKRVDSVPKEIIEQHYGKHKGRFFYDFTCEYFVGKPVVLAVYEGIDVVERVRAVMGNTDPVKANVGTIREKYGDKTPMEILNDQGIPAKNVVHGSGSPEEAAREIEIWKKYLFGDRLLE